MRNKPRFFVMSRSLWTTDSWKPIAGPFETRTLAEDAAMQMADSGFNEYGLQNLRDVRKTRVMTWTECRKLYHHDMVGFWSDLHQKQYDFGEGLLTVEQAATFKDCHPETIRRALRRGEFRRARAVGSSGRRKVWLLDAEEVQAWQPRPAGWPKRGEQTMKVNVFWKGAGWYAPVQEGEGWSVVNWERVCDPDLERSEADEAARWQGRGTPRLLTSEEEAKALED